MEAKSKGIQIVHEAWIDGIIDNKQAETLGEKFRDFDLRLAALTERKTE